MHIYKSHGIIKNNKEKEHWPLALRLLFLSICLEDRNVFARFDEIPSMTL